MLHGGIFVPGKPLTDIWGAPGLRWREQLQAHITRPLTNPYLTFTRNDRSWFDLDNLVYPVVAVSGCSACESIWASVERGEPEGVLIREAVPPTPLSVDSFALYIARPSTSSVSSRAVIPELHDVEAFGGDGPLGLALEFDGSDVAVGDLSYDGPTKSCIDDLTPLFGETMISGRMLAKDYRVRELRITRGHAPERAGVTVTLWHLADREPVVPTRRPDPSASSQPTATEHAGMRTTFLDDDAGFIRWRDTHPGGFVVNHEPQPKPTYLKVHRATCRTLNGTHPAHGDNWTSGYGKTCSDDMNELRRWALALGGDLDPCHLCN
jgi:hypothetical protein